MRSCCCRCCVCCCCVSPDKKIGSFIISVLLLMFLYNVLILILSGEVEIYVCSIIINILMLYFIGYKHRLVYSKSFKRWYKIFIVVIILIFIISILSLVYCIITLSKVENELLRYDNLNFTEEEIKKIRDSNSDELEMYKTNSTMNMKNEADKNYIFKFLDLQNNYKFLKYSIYCLIFELINRIIVLIMLAYIYYSTIHFYQIEEFGDESVNVYETDIESYSRVLYKSEILKDNSKILEDNNRTIDGSKILEDTSRNFGDSSGIFDRSRILGDTSKILGDTSRILRNNSRILEDTLLEDRSGVWKN